MNSHADIPLICRKKRPSSCGKIPPATYFGLRAADAGGVDPYQGVLNCRKRQARSFVAHDIVRSAQGN